MEDSSEITQLYQRVLEQVTLYNQYKNDVNFEEAKKISELVLKINNLAIKYGKFKGSLNEELETFENKLESLERNRSVMFL